MNQFTKEVTFSYKNRPFTEENKDSKDSQTNEKRSNDDPEYERLAIIIGSQLLVVILIVLICCCCKSGTICFCCKKTPKRENPQFTKAKLTEPPNNPPPIALNKPRTENTEEEKKISAAASIKKASTKNSERQQTVSIHLDEMGTQHSASVSMRRYSSSRSIQMISSDARSKNTMDEDVVVRTPLHSSIVPFKTAQIDVKEMRSERSADVRKQILGENRRLRWRRLKFERDYNFKWTDYF